MVRPPRPRALPPRAPPAVSSGPGSPDSETARAASSPRSSLPLARAEPSPARPPGPAAASRVPHEILAALRRAGLLELDDRPAAEPLTGGVSSDIWRVETAAGPVCVKRALARLRVAAEWRAPGGRGGHAAGRGRPPPP